MNYSVSLTYVDGEEQVYSFGGDEGLDAANAFAEAQAAQPRIVNVAVAPVWTPATARQRVGGTFGS